MSHEVSLQELPDLDAVITPCYDYSSTFRVRNLCNRHETVDHFFLLMSVLNLNNSPKRAIVSKLRVLILFC